jgi:ATP-dependent 26S proteasome regulatory subunit
MNLILFPKVEGSSISDATERVVNQLLTELDGIEELEKVVVIAATNRKDLIDPALLRPGRIDIIIELSIPDQKTRKKIFEVHTKNMPLDKNIDLEEYVKKTDNWTGAEISALCRNAGVNAIKRYYQNEKKGEFKIEKEDFDKAFENISKTIGKGLKNES